MEGIMTQKRTLKPAEIKAKWRLSISLAFQWAPDTFQQEKSPPEGTCLRAKDDLHLASVAVWYSLAVLRLRTEHIDLQSDYGAMRDERLKGRGRLFPGSVVETQQRVLVLSPHVDSELAQTSQ